MITFAAVFGRIIPPILLLTLAGLAAEPAPLPPDVSPGAGVDVAPWGERTSWENGRDAGIWWEDPRDIQSVVFTFEGAAPDPAKARLQWWQSQWPEHRVPRDQPAGAGESGWGHLGDLYQGTWRDADVYLQTEGSSWTFTFRHLNAREFPDLKDFAPEYRTTMKLRLLCEGPAPKVTGIRAFTDSTWQRVRVALVAENPERAAAAQFTAFNGHVVSAAPAANGRREVEVWFATSQNVNTFDSTVVTVRGAGPTFSFDPLPLAGGQPVLAPAYGVAVLPAESQETYRTALAKREEFRTRAGELPLYERVFKESEQSLNRAFAEHPPRPGHIYLPAGLEGGRQRFGIQADGTVFCVNDRIEQPPGRDSTRMHWGGQRLDIGFDLPAGEPAKRWIEEDCLPIIHTEWDHEGIHYHQTAFATRLEPGGLGFPDVQADTTTVLLVRLAGHNTAAEYKPAHVAMSLHVDGKAVPLKTRENLVFAQLKEGEPLRAMIDGQGQARPPETDGKIQYFGNMPPGADGAIVVKLPFITLDTPAELERLRDLDFDQELARARKFWKSRADFGTQVSTPVPELNRFFRAHVSHLMINCGREPGADRLAARVGGFSYGVFGNESCMMITDLDRRGFHAEAERCLETFLHYQGSVKLPGDYATQDGIFNGAFGWEQGGYNQHHGWIMWAMAEHYWYSGDKAWLARSADRLVRAARWITHERARTRDLTGLRAIERGLLPPGSLEDIGDWRGWMSNNGFSWWGLDAVARALADIQHPAAKELQAEADAYKRDILTAFTQAMERAPLVPLRDGAWIPQIPSEVHRRGRTFGWITVTLEGPIYFLRTGLMAPDHPLSLPIMQDYEDNLYLSERYGYSWERHGRQWFSRGGISMQPNLLCSPHPYLYRDEIKHYLRAYFNAFASCYYPDTQMMCEHPLPDLGNWRGDHYKASDEANTTYWLRLMFVEDDRGDDVLRLGLALPRAWLADGQSPSLERAATHFGPMTIAFASQAKSGQITATIDPPTRRLPKETVLRFRHPGEKPLRKVEVNGKAWDRFDPAREWVLLPPLKERTTVVAHYDP